MLSGNLTLSISDHLTYFLIVPQDNQNHTPTKHNLYTRQSKNFDRVSFTCDYFEIQWDTILETEQNNVNTSPEIFLAQINELLD